MIADRHVLNSALEFIGTITIHDIRFDERGPYLHLSGQALQKWAATTTTDHPIFQARSQVARAILKLVDDDAAGERKFVAVADLYSADAADRAFDVVDRTLNEMIKTPGARRFHERFSTSD